MLLRQIIERLRDYDIEEVVVICNKFRTRRNQPPLDHTFLRNLANNNDTLPPDAPL